jgi:hypothetical protein
MFATLLCMAIDVDKIPKTHRLKLIQVGEQFGSQDTLEQANQTIWRRARRRRPQMQSGLSRLHCCKRGPRRRKQSHWCSSSCCSAMR